MNFFCGVATPSDALDGLRRVVHGDGAFGWSSGAFAALSSSAPRVFLFEPPFQVGRENDWRQQLAFLRVLGWSALRQRHRALRAFWRMVTRHEDGHAGVDSLDAATWARLASYEGPLLAPLFQATGRDLRLPTACRGECVPVHLAVGSSSTRVMHAAARRLQALLPGASLDVLDGLDHLAPLTHSARIAEWIHSVR